MVLTSGAQLLFRLAMMNAAPDAFGGHGIFETLSTVSHAVDFRILVTGVAMYGLSMLFWVFALTRLPVNLAYPLLSVSYVIVYFVATLVPAFGEHGTAQRLFGVALIVGGVSVLGLGRDGRDSPVE